jgi:diguanylate cyclase (GGDEF)-like protein
MTIRNRILAGCLALTLLSALLGGCAQIAERRLGRLALDIYDNAFMAVSYLRAAQLGFATLASLPVRRAPTAAESQDLLDDLDIAVQRAMSPRGREQAAMLRLAVAGVLPKLATAPAEAKAVEAGFDRLVETFADDGFRYRYDVGRLVAAQTRQTGLLLAGTLAIALLTTALLARSIAPPIGRAVRIAQSIAAGRLDNAIVVQGHGETADLLRALAVMQASIAAGMARIEALMAAQAESHADEIALQNAQMAAALENMNQGLCLFDESDRLLVANRQFTRMFGAAPLGEAAPAILHAAGLGALVGIAGATIEALSCDLADGRSIAVSQQAIRNGGWVATYEDVSERRAAEARLAHMARHDLLTGLPNRLLLAEHVRAVLARQHEQGSVAMLCVDLDRFKCVNDTLGHHAGDMLLRAVAERMQSCCREDDVVVRLGGDEFAVVQIGRQPTAASGLAQRLVGLIAEPFTLDGQVVEIGASIGVALAEDVDRAQPEELLKCADLALYRAKADGRGCFRFFEAGMDLRMRERRALELDLRAALKNGELEIYYQPQIATAHGLSGFEALLRWNHPVRGLVGPADFIPLAEEIGLIGTLGDWVLRNACRTAAAWPGELKVAVNLSPTQFRAGTLADDVADALRLSGLAPQRLELEITEALLIQDDQGVIETLQSIRRLGVRIAMDDFGTGYSSLAYLSRFPFDKIKIDQSFVRQMFDNPESLAIIRAVIGLGRSLGMAINAEGVETQEQRIRLTAEGCGELQGYLFGRPLPVASIAGLLPGPDHRAAAVQQPARRKLAVPTPLG